MPGQSVQFQYPEGRWGLPQGPRGGPPTMDKLEWETWLSGPGAQGGSVIGTDTPIIRETVPKGGFLAPKNHPQMKDLKKDFDMFTVPHEGWGQYLFMKPKEKPQAPLVSEGEAPMRTV